MIPILLNIIILFDNYAHTPGTEASWGFSCLIEYNQKVILLDTGASGEILLKNADKLKVDLSKVDLIFISHEHWDHTNGLKAVLTRAKKAKVCYPETFSDAFKKLAKQSQGVIEIGDEGRELYPGVYTSGTMHRPLDEQALYLKTEPGTVVITGCAHPGIVNITERSIEVTGEKPYMVIGGFHLMNKSDKEIQGIIERLKKLGVKKVVPTHCSGDNARKLFEEAFDEDFYAGGVGRNINIQK